MFEYQRQLIVLHINVVPVIAADVVPTPCLGEGQNRPPLSNLTNIYTQSRSETLKNKGKVIDQSYQSGHNLFEDDLEIHNNVDAHSYHQLGDN